MMAGHEHLVADSDSDMRRAAKLAFLRKGSNADLIERLMLIEQRDRAAASLLSDFRGYCDLTDKQIGFGWKVVQRNEKEGTQ